MRAKSWACIALVCAAVGASGQNPAPASAPPPREKPSDEAWLPKPGSDPGTKRGKIEGLTADPPSAFPDLVAPVIPKGDPKSAAEWQEKYQAAFAKVCPRLSGTIVLKIEAADDTLRKLLKARLHQGTFEFQQRQLWREILGPGWDLSRNRDCLLDLQAAAVELWAEQPKELVPWLEELLVSSKELERYTRIRVELGSLPVNDIHAATRCRLKIEAELWKAKNPK